MNSHRKLGPDVYCLLKTRNKVVHFRPAAWLSKSFNYMLITIMLGATLGILVLGLMMVATLFEIGMKGDPNMTRAIIAMATLFIFIKGLKKLSRET